MRAASAPARAAFEVGSTYEAGLSEADRRQGAHYTPPEVAALLVRQALARWTARRPPRVCDPACGGGVFLVAVAEELVSRGVDPAVVVSDLVSGVDRDPGAVAAAARALVLWAEGHGVMAPVPRVRRGDGLLGDLDGEVDVVVGNPPFLGQLASDTARGPAERAALAERFGASARGYVDTAALFLHRALDLVGDGGVVAMLQPRSVLVARDAGPVRRLVTERGHLAAAWLPGERLFAALVDVCALVVTVGAPAAPTAVLAGREGEPVGEVDPALLASGPTWSALWAVAQRVPPLPEADPMPDGAPATVGDVADATAGFRDEYYAVVGALRADRPAHGARVVTTAMIDPGRLSWADRRVRIGGSDRVAPWVDLDALPAGSRPRRWVDRMLVPKVLVATQTRIIEAVADPSGDTVPLTPVIAVLPRPGSGVGADLLAAALVAPAATVWALHHFGGGGLASGTMRLAAAQVAQIPLPPHRAPWAQAAALLAAPSGAGAPDLDRVGELLDLAWGHDDPGRREWWRNRFPRSRAESLH